MSPAAILALFTSTAAAQSDVLVIQYTTDGNVDLSANFVDLHTVALEVHIIGCDYGYYDELIMNPAAASSAVPYLCLPCDCEDFEHPRTEPFVEE